MNSTFLLGVGDNNSKHLMLQDGSGHACMHVLTCLMAHGLRTQTLSATVDASEILHQLACQISHYLQGFMHVRWLFGISSMSRCAFTLFTNLPTTSISKPDVPG